MKSLFFVINRRDSCLYTRKQVSDLIEHHYCVQQTLHASQQWRFDYLYYLLRLIQISCNALQFNQRICFLSALHEWHVVQISTSVLSDLFKWHYHLQQDLEETQVTCTIDFA